MGIDLTGIRKHRSGRRTPVSRNPYTHLLVKLYRLLSRRTESKFNGIILKRLSTSRLNRPNLSLSRIVKHVTETTAKKTIVVVGTVTDDTRLADLPALTIAALKFSAKARARVLANGGQVLTLDQLAVAHPRGNNCVLLRGRKNARETCRHWGAPGVPGDHAKPPTSGRGPERARGRRKSRGFKVKK